MIHDFLTVTNWPWIHVTNTSLTLYYLSARDTVTEHIPECVSRVRVEIPENVFFPFLSGLAWREKAWTLGKTHRAAYKRGKGLTAALHSSLLTSGESRHSSSSHKGSLCTSLSFSRKMALSQRSGALLLFVVAAVCIQLYQGELKSSL